MVVGVSSGGLGWSLVLLQPQRSGLVTGVVSGLPEGLGGEEAKWNTGGWH